MSGEVVAWRNRVGDRWHYCERDPREVHDNGKQTDALVLATDYAALQAKLDAVTSERERLHEALRELCTHMISYSGLCRMTGYDKLIPLIQASAKRIAALTDQGRAGEGGA